MSIQTFTTEQQALHDNVKNAYKTAIETREKDSGERAARKAYTPEHDLQLLKVLSEGDRAGRFGSSSTEDKKELCEEIAVILKDTVQQERSADSLYYRITKLLKADLLSAINYRVKGEDDETDDKPKAPKAPREPKTPKAAKSTKATEVPTTSAVVAPAPTAPAPAVVVATTPPSAKKEEKKVISDDSFLD